jgi:hypothetical protein
VTYAKDLVDGVAQRNGPTVKVFIRGNRVAKLRCTSFTEERFEAAVGLPGGRDHSHESRVQILEVVKRLQHTSTALGFGKKF